MSSIVTRIRFTDKHLAYAIDSYLRLGIQPPTTLNNLVRGVFVAGLTKSLGGLFEDQEPSTTAHAILQTMTTQKAKLPANDHQLQQALTGQESALPDLSTPIPNTHLLVYLNEEDKKAGNNMLATMATGQVTLIDNLNSTNEKVRRIAYEMFVHATDLTKQEQLAINNFKEE